MRLITRLLLPVAVLCFAIDQLSKWWVTGPLDMGYHNPYLAVMPPFLQFQYAENPGINFGIKVAGPWVLIGLSVAISAGLSWWVSRKGRRDLALGAGLIVGGALGNAWDRLTHGAVIDFINNACCGFDNPFSYNIADIFIFAGAIWIALRA